MSHSPNFFYTYHVVLYEVLNEYLIIQPPTCDLYHLTKLHNFRELSGKITQVVNSDFVNL